MVQGVVFKGEIQVDKLGKEMETLERDNGFNALTKRRTIKIYLWHPQL